MFKGFMILTRSVIYLFLFTLFAVWVQSNVKSSIGLGRPQGRHGRPLIRLRADKTKSLVTQDQFRRIIGYFLMIAEKKKS